MTTTTVTTNKATLQQFTTWHLLKTTLLEWNADNAAHLSAALAYYTFFSLVPLLIIATAIAGLVFGREAASGELVNQISLLMLRTGSAAISGGSRQGCRRSQR